MTFNWSKRFSGIYRSNDAESVRHFAKWRGIDPKHAKFGRKSESIPVLWLSRSPGNVQEEESFLQIVLVCVFRKNYS